MNWKRTGRRRGKTRTRRQGRNDNEEKCRERTSVQSVRNCVRDLAGDARGTVATCAIREGEEAKEGKEEEKKPGPPPADRPTRETERDGLSPKQIVIAAML